MFPRAVWSTVLKMLSEYQWRSQNAQKVTHINGRLLDQAIITRDVQNELLIVLYLDIHVGHDKNQYIPI